MSREIKFRVWSGVEMLPPLTIQDVVSELSYLSEYHSPDLIFQQFTGLFDKNGREIYEGDIIEEKWIAPIGNMQDKYLIRFGTYEDSDGFQSVGFYQRWILNTKQRENDSGSSIYQQIKENRRVVIGNIFENRQLLEK